MTIICVAIPWKHRKVFTCKKWGVVFPPESWGMERNVIMHDHQTLFPSLWWVKGWPARLGTYRSSIENSSVNNIINFTLQLLTLDVPLESQALDKEFYFRSDFSI